MQFPAKTPRVAYGVMPVNWVILHWYACGADGRRVGWAYGHVISLERGASLSVKQEVVLDFYTAFKNHLLALLVPYTPNSRFPCTFTGEVPTLLYTWSWKKVPPSGGDSAYRPLYGVPPGSRFTRALDILWLKRERRDCSQSTNSHKRHIYPKQQIFPQEALSLETLVNDHLFRVTVT